MSIQYRPLPYFGATITATDEFRTGYKAYTSKELPPDSELQQALDKHVDNYTTSVKGYDNLKDEGEIIISGYGSKNRLHVDLMSKLLRTDGTEGRQFFTKDPSDTVHERAVPDNCVDRWINWGTAMLVSLIDMRGK